MALRFGPVEIRPEVRQVWLDGAVVPLGSRALDLLLVLAGNAERVVTKDEIFARVWPGLVVEDNNLSVQISALRRALGAESIKTVSGRGYQWALAPEPRHAAVPAARGNLAGRAPRVLGRDADEAQLLHLFEREALVTVCGIGGVGKTALALCVARALAQRLDPPDGVWVVDLSVVSTPAAVPVAVCQTLGIALDGGRDALAECIAHVRHRQLVLLLDNCEHVIDAVARLVTGLLGSAPEVRILATSQEPLRVPGERVMRLNPLLVPASSTSHEAREAGAVLLMMDRLRSQRGDGFEPSASEFAELVEICRQLDGVPLALELAASRVPLLGIAGVRSRLHDRLRLLSGGVRTAPPRHRSVQATLDWSFSLLGEVEQRLLEQLSVFPASFSLRGAALLVGAASETALIEPLEVLVQRSLVDTVGSERPRYRLLETTRAFALEALAARGDGLDWQARLAQAMCQLCQRLTRERDNAGMWQEMPNFRHALAWCLATPGQGLEAVTLATHTAVVLATDGANGEALHNLRSVEARVSDGLPAALVARYWHWLGRLGFEGRSPSSSCIDALTRADAMFEASNEPRHRHACQRHLAEAWLRSGRHERAEHHLAIARQLESASTPAVDRMRRLRVDALLADDQGRFDEALRMGQAALALAEAHGIERYRMQLRADLALMHLHMGQAEAAVSGFQDVLQHLDESIRQGLARARALSGLTAALVAAQRVPEACRVAASSLAVLRRANLLDACCDVFAWLAVAAGDGHAAAFLLGAGERFLARSETTRDPIGQLARAHTLQALSDRLSEAEIGQGRSRGMAADDAELLHVLNTAFAPPVC